MNMIPIHNFEAQWESSDDHGKRHLHHCTVVGVNSNDELVIISQAENGAIGTFAVPRVWPVELRELRRVAR
jgi:hypothetical protein